MSKLINSDDITGVFNSKKEVYYALTDEFQQIPSSYVPPKSEVSFRLSIYSTVRIYDRYPELTLTQGLSRVGGLLAILRVVSILFFTCHQRHFERRLSRYLTRHDTAPSSNALDISSLKINKSAAGNVDDVEAH